MPHGCTHADDLIYVFRYVFYEVKIHSLTYDVKLKFSTGLFDRKGDDMKIVQDFSSLWTTFATTGTLHTRTKYRITALFTIIYRTLPCRVR